MYLDDCYVVARPGVMEEVLAKVFEEFGQLGLETKASKTKTWSSQPSQLPLSLQQTYSEPFGMLKQTLQAPGDTEHQGVRLRGGLISLESETLRLQQMTARLQALVQNGLDLQTAVSLLRSYAGPASQYALRSDNVSIEGRLTTMLLPKHGPGCSAGRWTPRILSSVCLLE